MPPEGALIDVCDSLHLQDQKIYFESSIQHKIDCGKIALRTCLRLIIALLVLWALVPCNAVGCRAFSAPLLAIAMLLLHLHPRELLSESSC